MITKWSFLALKRSREIVIRITYSFRRYKLTLFTYRWRSFLFIKRWDFIFRFLCVKSYSSRFLFDRNIRTVIIPYRRISFLDVFELIHLIFSTSSWTNISSITIKPNIPLAFSIWHLQIPLILVVTGNLIMNSIRIIVLKSLLYIRTSGSIRFSNTC